MNRIPTTFTAFKIATGLNGNPEHRGTMMRDVDRAFENYDLSFAGVDDHTQYILTSTLFVACKNWLRDKQSKSIVKENFLRPSTYNNNLYNRREALSKVATQCLEILQADGADLSQTVVPLRDFTTGKNRFLRQSNS